MLVALTNEVSHCLVVTSRALSCVGGTDQLSESLSCSHKQGT